MYVYLHVSVCICMYLYVCMCICMYHKVLVGMYLPRPAVAGRRVWDRRSGLLLRVGRRWMVLAASIVVHLATTTSATGIRVGVIDSCKARCLPLSAAGAAQVRHRSRGAGTAGPATGCGIGHIAAAPCLSPSVCHGRLVSAKICMRLETPVAVRALQARPDTPTRSCGPGHCTHKPEQGVDQNRNCHGHSVACH